MSGKFPIINHPFICWNVTCYFTSSKVIQNLPVGWSPCKNVTPFLGWIVIIWQAVITACIHNLQHTWSRRLTLSTCTHTKINLLFCCSIHLKLTGGIQKGLLKYVTLIMDMRIQAVVYCQHNAYILGISRSSRTRFYSTDLRWLFTNAYEWKP